jgi:hypothetical protein
MFSLSFVSTPLLHFGTKLKYIHIFLSLYIQILTEWYRPEHFHKVPICGVTPYGCLSVTG